ncbi:GNAT family N-acetyltransferase [Vibrio hangzhouensis]|uniref:GNAT family N-acetyltransferase n=1 Tax=Vibrio hangzhouensis TaxID=462991 RepID=UPI001C93D1A4|nr:GNAT family N-acetyltransferase [Vibrio hangzhouensis]MBY6198454.1 GNAT family N-acetyltransferase [Vibrio hangzhouensis]
MNELVMRVARPEDYDSYYKIKCDPKNVEWSGFSTPPKYDVLKQRYEQFFSDEKQGLLLFESDNRVIGYVNYWVSADGREIETSHGALSEKTVKGLGTKMLRLAIAHIEHGDNRLQAQSIIGWVSEYNIASLQNVLRNGYKSTGETEIRQIGSNEHKFTKYKRAKTNYE